MSAESYGARTSLCAQPEGHTSLSAVCSAVTPLLWMSADSRWNGRRQRGLYLLC